MRAMLAALLLLLVPLAAADQTIPIGPVTVKTIDQTYGDGCRGSNGGEYRVVQTRIADPRDPHGYVDVDAFSSCYRYDAGGGNVYSGTYDGVQVYSYAFGTTGPSAYFGDNGGESAGQKYCGSVVGTGGAYESLGCLSPDGSPPPMLPQLP